MKVLYVLGGGIGNIIQATPAIKATAAAGHTVDLVLFCDTTKCLDIYKITGVRNIYHRDNLPTEKYDVQLKGPFTPGQGFNANKKLNTRIHYAQHKPESDVYFDLAKQIGVKSEKPFIEINVPKSGPEPICKDMVAIYPGSKPNWAMKRWNKYDQLAQQFEHVALVGKEEDFHSHGEPAWIKRDWEWPKHVEFVTGNLNEITHYISKCNVFIGNDGGLAHIAAATGIPTYVIFGPSSIVKNKPFAPNAKAIAADLSCRPCQFKSGNFFNAKKNDCQFHMKCMKELTVEDVLSFIKNGKDVMK